MRRFSKVLIANRGEIALRVIRALKAKWIKSVAIYSEVDRLAPYVLEADEAYPLGGIVAADTYLNLDKIVQIIKAAGVDAVHPGYGFLSENSEFARVLADSGVEFIGPTGDAIEAMGDKTRARQLMQKANVPVVPGTLKPLSDAKEAQKVASEIGYPVLLKAAAGGGGKGMRVVEGPDEIVSAFESAQREAKSAFGDGSIYIEKYIKNPRHIEIQILADAYGNTVHLFERECSVQRRHQKVIEESPASNLPVEVRNAMGEVAVRAAKAVGYRSAGTVEFLVDEDYNFYFLEMNTRLQVEHPVTEIVTGVDLVDAMIRVAEGEELWLSQDDLRQRGHAIEARVYAEDPANNFMPAPGDVKLYRPPEGPWVRVDDGLREGMVVSRYYDPMIAKVIGFGADRDAAIDNLVAALREFEIAPIKTNIDFLVFVLESSIFRSGRYDTGILKKISYESKNELNIEDVAAVVAAYIGNNKVEEEGSGKREISRWRTVDMIYNSLSRKVL